MALVSCKECGHKISSDVKACPQCGKKRTSSGTKGCAVLIVLFALFAVIGFIVSDNAQVKRSAILTPQQRAAERERKAKEDLLNSVRGICLMAVKESLNDPYSAKFDPSWKWFIEEKEDGLIRVQPTGRAKNAFGAYIHGTWECVIKPDGINSGIVSLKQIRP
jgi:hypothetical protein